MSCTRAGEFLQPQGIEIAESVDARRERMDEAAAWKLLKGAGRIRIAKGKKVLEFKSPKPSDKAEILKGAMGPSGNLRAPTLRFGQEVIVGYSEPLYREAFLDS